jgi:KDO2-lipid IV(A) lauroyltransferase
VAAFPYAPPALRRLLARAPWLGRLAQALEAWGLALFLAALRGLGPDRAARVGAALFGAWGPWLRKARHVRANLGIAFPERSAREIEALERGVWGSFGAMLADYAHLDEICRRDGGRVEVVVKGNVRALQDEGRPVVLATAHVGNYQLATYAASRLGIPVTALYTPTSNPRVDRMITRLRRPIASRLVPRDGGVRALVRELSCGRSVGLVVDTRTDGSAMIPFFGRPVPTTTLPARLALRFGCELVPIRVERMEGARFRVTVYAPLVADEAQGEKEQALAMTRMLNARFEDWIRERPEEWQCLKRRWPKR